MYELAVRSCVHAHGVPAGLQRALPGTEVARGDGSLGDAGWCLDLLGAKRSAADAVDCQLQLDEAAWVGVVPWTRDLAVKKTTPEWFRGTTNVSEAIRMFRPMRSQ
jgi:hypothetical protein